MTKREKFLLLITGLLYLFCFGYFIFLSISGQSLSDIFVRAKKEYVETRESFKKKFLSHPWPQATLTVEEKEAVFPMLFPDDVYVGRYLSHLVYGSQDDRYAVTLYSDRTAELVTIAYASSTPNKVNRGSWSVNTTTDHIVVVLTQQNNKPLVSPLYIEFFGIKRVSDGLEALSGIGLSPIQDEYPQKKVLSTDVFFDQTFLFPEISRPKIDVLDGTRWQWVQTVYPGGRKYIPRSKEYTLSFYKGGFGSYDACNSTSGSYAVVGSRLLWRGGFSTMVGCSFTKDHQHFKDNGYSFVLSGDKLWLTDENATWGAEFVRMD